MLHQINFIVLGRSDTENLDYLRIYVCKYFFSAITYSSRQKNHVGLMLIDMAI